MNPMGIKIYPSESSKYLVTSFVNLELIFRDCPFSKNKERIPKFMQTGNTDCIYKNDLDKACFDMIRLMVNTKICPKEQNQIKC